MKIIFQLYRFIVSPLLHAVSLTGSAATCGCRFHPSCSRYAELAVRRLGWWRGGLLALRRLSRCHPWSSGGIDEVPLKVSVHS